MSMESIRGNKGALKAMMLASIAASVARFTKLPEKTAEALPKPPRIRRRDRYTYHSTRAENCHDACPHHRAMRAKLRRRAERYALQQAGIVAARRRFSLTSSP